MDDPIIAEIRATRDKHAAQFNYDLKEIFRDIRAKQKLSGKKYERHPARPAVLVEVAVRRH